MLQGQKTRLRNGGSLTVWNVIDLIESREVMRNCSAICAETVVVGMVGVGEVQDDVADAITSDVIVALVRSLDQFL